MTARLPQSESLLPLAVEAVEALDVDGHELLVEALLRRGFLAALQDGNAFLAPGSHPDDVEVLGQCLDLRPGRDKRGSQARGKLSTGRWLSPRSGESFHEAALRVIAVPESTGFTNGGFEPRRGGWPRWGNYRSWSWGTSVPVCSSTGGGSLDVGVALLVKALPLLGCSTAFSCDGHGTGAAKVRLRTPWDAAWLRAYLDESGVLSQVDATIWDVGAEEPVVRIVPLESPRELLEDVQRVARCALDFHQAQVIRQARLQALTKVAARGCSTQEWRRLARAALRAQEDAIKAPRPDRWRHQPSVRLPARGDGNSQS